MGWLVFTNIYVALCGAALTVATYPLLGLPARVDAAVVLVFCATLVVYNLDRLVEPNPGDSPHERWVERHRGALWALTLCAAAGCDAVFWWLSPAARWSLIAPAALAMGYCLPMIPAAPTGPAKARWCRLKDVPRAKLVLIVAVWAYATAVLPALQAGADFTPTSAAVLLAGRVLFLAAVALPFDVPDMARDRAGGLVTLPQKLGIAGTRQVALGLASGFVVLAAFHPWPAAAALLVSGTLTLALLTQLSERRGTLYYAVGLDGLLLLQATLILLTTIQR